MNISVAESQTVSSIRALDYAVKGDGVTDDGPAVLRMLEKAIQSAGPIKIQFDSGKKYYLKTGKNRYAFILDNCRDIILDGGGSTFLIDKDIRWLKVVHSENITVQNFVVDYVPPPFVDGIIMAYNKQSGTLDVRIDEGFTTPPAGGPTKQDGEQAYFGFLWSPGTYSAPECGGSYLVRHNVDVLDTKPINTSMVRVITNPAGWFFDSIQPGETRFSVPVSGVAHRFGPGESCVIASNTNVTMENVDMYSAPWFAYGINGNRGRLVFRNVNLRPGAGRISSAARDGFHVKFNRSSLLWENCTVQGNGDDAYNIASYGFTIIEVISPTRIKISQNFPLGVVPMEMNDTLVFYSPSRGKILGNSKIAGLNPANYTGDNPPVYMIDLDTAIDDIKIHNTWVWNVESSNPHTILRNCRVDTSCRMRSPMLIDTCKFNALAWFTGDSLEAPVPGNIRACNSTFRLGQGNPELVVAFNGPDSPAEPVIFHVEFENNRVWGDFIMKDTAHAALTDNTFMDGNHTVHFENVENLTLTRNIHGSLPLKADH